MDRLTFVFNDKNSNDMGIFANRQYQILPPRTARQIQLAGKHGLYDLGDSTYGNRTITLTCMFVEPTRADAIEQWHKSIKWLSKENAVLTFSDDLKRHWRGTCYNASELTDRDLFGEFVLVFDVYPFAFGDDTILTAQGNEVVEIPIDYEGNQPTCEQFIITNIGSQPISDISIIKTDTND